MILKSSSRQSVRRFIGIGLFVMCFSFANAQLIMRGSLVVPTLDHGLAFKPGLGISLGLRLAEDQYQPFQFEIYAMYYSLEARRDTFPTYLVTSDHNNTGRPGIVQGYETFDNHMALMIGMGLEYRLLDSDLSPFAGLDLVYFGESYDNDYGYEGVITADSEVSSENIGVLPRVGINYAFYDYLIAVDLGYRITGSESGVQQTWISSLSATVFFE